MENLEMNKIENSSSKIWTATQLTDTKKTAKAMGLTVSPVGFAGLVTIRDPRNGKLILKSMNGPRGMKIVRIDQSYFGVDKDVYVK